MASGIVEPGDMECSVCHEDFTEPKLLPCGHLLCCQCLLNWMKSQDDACCPLCRDVIVTSSEREGRSLEDVAAGLPTDLSMELILEASRLLNKQHRCCVCEDVAATSMCLDCKDTLCSSCRNVHGKLSCSKHHAVEDLSALTVEKLVENHSSSCSVHPGEVSKLFCSSHGESICLVCATLNHRSCTQMKDLGEKMVESQALLQQLAARLTDGETELDEALGELDQFLHDTQQYAETAMAEVDEVCDQLNALVKEKRQQLKEEVMSACSEVEETVKDGKNCFLQKQTKLTTHRQVVKRVGKVKNQQVVPTMSFKLEKRVNELDCSKILPADAKNISTFKFVQNPSAMTQIKEEFTKLGKIEFATARINANRNRCFVFHNHHGSSIALSNGNRTGSKSTNDGFNGIVFSRDPLDVNILYEVQIDKWVPGRQVCVGYKCMLVGAAADPASMTLSAWSGNIMWPAWICPSFTFSNGSQDYSNRIGAALISLGAGHRVGLALDSTRSLHLYVDGRDLGIAVRNMPDPCYAMFDVVDNYEQITALPATRLE